MKKIIGTAVMVLVVHASLTTGANAQSGWYWQNPLPQGNGLYGVCFTDVNRGIAVGDCSAILRTTDGGVTWTQQMSGAPEYLMGVSFPDVNTGFAVGSSGTIHRTTDGGVTWQA